MAARFYVEAYGLQAAKCCDASDTKGCVARLRPCGSCTRIKVTNEALKARKITQGVEVVILFDPDREGDGVDPQQAVFERV